MTMIQLIACIGMIVGLFMVLHVSPRELSDSLFARLTAAPGSIRADINETTRRKKAGFLRREITEAQAVLAASGRTDKFPLVCFTSMLCFALGACIAIAAGNAFLVPVLAVGLMLTPFWYVKLTAGSFKKDVAAELETALSVITTAYPENWQRHSYVACCGTSIQPVLQMLEQAPQLGTILLCLDNDEAGHQASRRMRGQLDARYSVERLIPENKDWNDDLTLSGGNAQGFSMNEMR